MTIQNPLFQPPSEWVCPEAIDYKGQSPVAIDLETYDPGIKDHGPGWATGNGKVVGVALAWDGFKGYWPIDHDAPGNYDKEVDNIAKHKHALVEMTPQELRLLHDDVTSVVTGYWRQVSIDEELSKLRSRR